jgi:hypothetical protein
MRRPHLIIGLLVAAMALLDACTWIGRSGHPNFVEWPTMILPCLALSQASLTAVWIGLGRSRWAVRGVVGTLLLGAIAAMFWQDGEPFKDDITIIAIQSLLIIASLVVLRWSGFRLVNLPYDDDLVRSQAKPMPWQFSVANILQLTAAVAVVSAVLTQIVGWSSNLLLFLIFAAAFAVPVPVLAWAILTTGRLSLRIAIAVMVAGTAAGSWFFWWPWAAVSLAVFCISQFALISLALVAVRISGYRFVRQRTIQSQEPACQ